jgi:hypothetical protein
MCHTRRLATLVSTTLPYQDHHIGFRVVTPAESMEGE